MQLECSENFIQSWKLECYTVRLFQRQVMEFRGDLGDV